MPPLDNIRILITRTRQQASDLAAQLVALGATPLLVPTIEIVPPPSFDPLDQALARLDTFDWLLFTSANAVHVFAERSALAAARIGNPSSARTILSPKTRIAAIGPATARALQAIGLTVDLLPPLYIAESFAAALTPHAPGASMLLIRAQQARDILPTALTAAGAHLTIADAYANRIPPDSISALQQLFASPSTYPHAITFTSSSTATNLVQLLQAANLTLPSGLVLASIGPITSQTLRELGLIPTLEAHEPTIPALIQSLTTHFTTR